MNSISNITNKIIADAESEAKCIRDDAEKAASEIMSEYMKQAEQESQKIIEAAEKDSEAVISTAMAKADMQNRMGRLACRRKLIDNAFEAAFSRIENLSEEEYVLFMKNMLKKAGGESAEIVLNAKDRSLYEKIVDGIEHKIELSDKVGEQKGGFVLINGETEINCTFEVLFKEARENLQDGVVDILFSEK